MPVFSCFVVVGKLCVRVRCLTNSARVCFILIDTIADLLALLSHNALTTIVTVVHILKHVNRPDRVNTLCF